MYCTQYTRPLETTTVSRNTARWKEDKMRIIQRREPPVTMDAGCERSQHAMQEKNRQIIAREMELGPAPGIAC